MNNQTRKITMAALCIALGVILPQLFHVIPNAGSIWLPMHLPVLIAGFVTNPLFGAIVGFITPILSSMLTSMPGPAVLPGMVCELTTYGLVAGLTYSLLKVKKPLKYYICLVVTMLAGRLVGGLLNGLIFKAGSYSLSIWATTYFVTGLPGIVVQLIIVPVIIYALDKAGLIK